MINVPLSFHQKAQGQVIEPKSRVMVSFEKNSQYSGQVEYLGELEQEAEPTEQCVCGKGYGTPTTASGYYTITNGVTLADLGNGWGHIECSANTTWVNAFIALGGVDMDINKTYTVLFEYNNVNNASSVTLSQNHAQELFSTSMGITFSSDGASGRYVRLATTKSSFSGVNYGFRCFFNKRTASANFSADIRVTIFEGDRQSDIAWKERSFSPSIERPSPVRTLQVGNVELASFDGLQDRIYKQNGVWYIHRETDSFVSEWSSGGAYGLVDYAKTSKPTNSKNYGNYSDFKVYIAKATYRHSPHGGQISGAWNDMAMIGRISGNASNADYWLGFPKGTPLADMKSALDGTRVYYELATPTTEMITDPATLAYLEAQDVGYFTLDQSLLDGTSLLGSSEDNPIQLWDTYDYTDYTDRLVSVDMEHSFEFPYSVQSAIADFVFENTDNYFTPTQGSAIDEYNLPRRPIKIYAGFANETVVPQFVGITEGMVDIDEKKAVAKYTALDFLTEIAELTLDSTIAMRNVRTNEVLAKIVEQFGVLPSQYNFENGDNIIPFVFFDKGQNAGEAIRKLVQAEAGRFWLDEMGILRFQKRYTVSQQPMITLPEYSIISAKPSGANKIINHINITCDLREVQEYQTVYTKKGSGDSTSNLWVVGANSSITRQCSLEDPCYDVQLPTLGHATSVSWFTAKTAGGVEVTSGITTTGELSTNAYTVTFTNNNNFAIEIDEIELWGEPAKVYDVLEYDSYDDESVEKYGEQLLEINDNQFFQSFNQAQNFAVYTLSERANYNASLDLTIKGDFSLQLGDYIEIEGDYAGAYVIDGIKWHLGVGNLETTLKVHKYTPVDYFTLDVSRLDGTDVLA